MEFKGLRIHSVSQITRIKRCASLYKLHTLFSEKLVFACLECIRASYNKDFDVIFL